MTDIYIDDKILGQIHDAAKDKFPQEMCGFIVENNGLLQFIETDNIHDQPEMAFLIDPQVYLSFVERLKVIVHSHTNRPSTPSSADMTSSERAAVPYMIYSYPGCEVSNYYPHGYKAPLEGRAFVYAVMDCFSLLRDFYQQHFNITVPDFVRKPYGWWNEFGDDYLLDNYQKAGFVKVDELQHGDAILMQIQARSPNHVGIYLGGGLILHHTLGMLSRKETYGHYWRKNTVGYFRHNSLLDHEND